MAYEHESVFFSILLKLVSMDKLSILSSKGGDYKQPHPYYDSFKSNDIPTNLQASVIEKRVFSTCHPFVF